MSRLIWKSVEAVFVLVLCCGFAPHVWCQNLDQTIQAKWADELAKEVGNPPERGQTPLNAFEGSERIAAVAAVAAVPSPAFNRYFSLLVTDVDSVSAIKFSDVMKQLAQQSGDPLFDKEMLFHQWWDTARKKPGLFLGPHCDDVNPSLDKNYQCPRQEGDQAIDATVFTDESADLTHNQDAYSAIAFSNRFDLLSPAQSAANGQVIYPDCGEYRIIFARNSGKTTPPSLAPDHALHPGDIFNRNLISFEFRLKNPNPKPQKPGVPQGCLPILQFWYGLSDITLTGAKRGELLKAYFMDGTMTTPSGQPLGTLPWKVVDIWNLSFGLGQIRTNQFLNTVTVRPPVPPTQYNGGTPGSTNVQPNDWVLREFRTLIVGEKVLIVPDSTKTVPDSSLFANGTNDDRVKILLDAIRDQASDLLGGKVNSQYSNLADINSIKFSMLKPGANAFQSDEGPPVPCSGPSSCAPGQGNIVSAFGSNNTNMTTDIDDDLIAVNSPTGILASNVVDRIRTQTCAGCHQFSDTKLGPVGFDDQNGLGGNAHWPTKACGDYAPTCTTPGFLLDAARPHPPMQFTQVSEVILTPSIADQGKEWRYAISSTVECMLDFREKFMEQSLGLPLTAANNCPH
jgi:hypothetical protein